MRAASLLDSDPAAAAAEAAALLQEHPDSAAAALLLGTARHSCGETQAATQVFATLARAQPHSALIQLEYARALAAAGEHSAARAALQRAVELQPHLAEAWRELSLLDATAGEPLACDRAYARYAALVHPDRELLEAENLLRGARLEAAEALLRRRLRRSPHDQGALRLAGECAALREDFAEAERLLGECLRLAPGDSAARLELVRAYSAQQKPEAMLPLLERLLALEPASLKYRTLQSIALNLLGLNAQALAVLTRLLEEFPQDERVWMFYAHVLRAGGSAPEAIAAYRKSITLAPRFAEAWFSLANMKTFHFSEAEIAVMESQLLQRELTWEERVLFEFALGKAREDQGAFAAAFSHYARGNELRRAALDYDVGDAERFVERNKTLYTRDFLAARRDSGSPSTAPIFIVGLPRSGSTLVEQILASHSQVEGTRELPYVLSIASDFGAMEIAGGPRPYPQSLAKLTGAQLRALGERYLAEAEPHRLQRRAHFIDKMPSNWMHIGLIQLMLPQARIIDVRRAALGCCVANFKQHFQQGMWFSYSLEDLGRYYRAYVQLMSHFEAALPGRVLRLQYENLVADLEGEVRRLLDYCGLAFEEQCLRFYETRRVVQTVSSEQVRRPIYQEGLEQWRNFEPWLGPLRTALGDLA
jgi:tetratricopeptide (TPR) repeat protein